MKHTVQELKIAYAVLKIFKEAKISESESELKASKQHLFHIRSISVTTPKARVNYKHLEDGKIEIEYLRGGFTKKVTEEKKLLDRFVNEVRSILSSNDISDANVKLNSKLKNLTSRLMLDRVSFSAIQNENRFFIQNINSHNHHNESFEIKLCLESSSDFTTTNNENSFRVKLSSLQPNKLRRLDTFMPLLLAWVSEAVQENKPTPLSSITKTIARTKRHDKKIPFILEYDFIKYKLTVLILHVILGAFSESNEIHALSYNHHYVFIKMNGELVCFHPRNISEFSEYLFGSAFLEKATPNNSVPKLQNNYIDKTKLDTNITFGFAII